MNFLNWIRKSKIPLDTYEQIGRKDLMKLISVDDKISYSLSPGSPNVNLIFDIIHDKDFLDQTDVYLASRIFGKGPKIFKPTSKQLHLLSETSLNLLCNEYTQPFETIVIELPEDYNCTKNPLFGQLLGDIEQKETHKPIACILYKDDVLLIISILFDSYVAMTSWLPVNIDESLESFCTEDILPTGLEICPEEKLLAKQLQRAVLSYCLLLDEVGVKANHSKERERLKKFIGKNNKHTPMNQMQLKLTPTYYSLNQEVILYRTVNNHSDLPSESTGTVVRPHSRRGHFRNQRYGPKNELSKRCRILPVFVNAHLFLGNMADNISRYSL